jgi:hypothetical protein
LNVYKKTQQTLLVTVLVVSVGYATSNPISLSIIVAYLPLNYNQKFLNCIAVEGNNYA